MPSSAHPAEPFAQISGRASPALTGYVLGYQGFRLGPGSEQDRLVVPDGSIKILFGFGARCRSPTRSTRGGR
ncbi:hypothetical protein GXW82_18290 [Streptacidiphilus sp. 4-A2]|nr:hypothetical protein [Streptacidiphilus sp. 4-A2]